MANRNCPTCNGFTPETNNRCIKCNNFLNPSEEIDFLKDQLLQLNNDFQDLNNVVIKMNHLIEMLIPMAELVEN